jgi:3-hydroxybutyryl-CoA dehydratase
MPRYLEEFVENEVLLSARRTITEADVLSFAALTGDWNEIHTSEEVARESRYGQRIAHGAFIFAVSIGLLQGDKATQPHVIAFLGVERLRFVRPVFLGDTIRVRQTVRSLNPVTPESGFLEVAEEVLNQGDMITLTYIAKFLVRRSGAFLARQP